MSPKLLWAFEQPALPRDRETAARYRHEGLAKRLLYEGQHCSLLICRWVRVTVSGRSAGDRRSTPGQWPAGVNRSAAPPRRSTWVTGRRNGALRLLTATAAAAVADPVAPHSGPAGRRAGASTSEETRRDAAVTHRWLGRECGVCVQWTGPGPVWTARTARQTMELGGQGFQ